MTTREDAAREYVAHLWENVDEISTATEILIEDAHEAGQRVGEARVRETVEEALINALELFDLSYKNAPPPLLRLQEALARLLELDQ